jgi:tRNA threonylcarbamoyl adenosine modification protein (Sua5/YciO/YrdC/YwlC family)
MPTQVLRVEDRSALHAELARAGAILRAGGLVAFPTETVYGIAAAASLPQAVERLYALKGRSRDKPTALMVSDVAEVRARCPRIPRAAERLMARFWPGPLTLVLRDAEGRMTGFRLPGSPLARGLVREAGVPLLVPSANRASHPPATTATQVLSEFPEGLDLVIDGGPAEGGVASTVVRVAEALPGEGADDDDAPDGRVDVLREGAIPSSRILDAGSVSVLFVCTGNTDRSPLAAAMLRRRLAQRLGCPESALEAHGLVVRSAGVEAVEGRPASPSLLRVAKEAPGGPLDLSSHRSRRLTEGLVEQATHVFCMERRHLEEVLAFFPLRAKDVRLVDPEGRDVDDPAGRGIPAYRRLATRLDAAAILLAGGLSESVSSS